MDKVNNLRDVELHGLFEVHLVGVGHTIKINFLNGEGFIDKEKIFTAKVVLESSNFFDLGLSKGIKVCESILIRECVRKLIIFIIICNIQDRP